MKRVLIFGGSYDIHSAMVRWGLKKLGHTELTLISWYDFPSIATSSIHLPKQGQSRIDFKSVNGTVASPYDVVWYRRPGSPTPQDGLHDTDLPFVEAETSDYIKGALGFLGHESTLWINHPAAANNARNKAVQLEIARDIGLRIPNTLISNDPKDINRFHEENDKSVIYKPFNPARWIADGEESEQHFILPTVLLKQSDLDEDLSISACPAIYQERIDIDIEIRVTVIGGEAICCQILSQERPGTIDWRTDLGQGKLRIEPYELPNNVLSQCLELCSRLSIRFGCIDLIVNNNGDFVFLEINESGQFLWIEELLPELPLLDTFCRFLADDNDIKQKPQIRLSEYLQSDAYTSDRLAFEKECLENKAMIAKYRVYRE